MDDDVDLLSFWANPWHQFLRALYRAVLPESGADLVRVGPRQS